MKFYIVAFLALMLGLGAVYVITLEPDQQGTVKKPSQSEDDKALKGLKIP